MLAAQIFSGAGVGLLLGMLLGLSSSPVVSLVVGALAALLASLVGIRVPGKEPAEAPTETVSVAQKRAAAFRAGVFGLSCLLGLLGGIYLRTHNALSPIQPSLKQQVDELVSVGFSAVEARRIAVLHSLTQARPRARPGFGCDQGCRCRCHVAQDCLIRQHRRELRSPQRGSFQGRGRGHRCVQSHG